MCNAHSVTELMDARMVRKKNRLKPRPKNPTKMQNGRMDGRKKNVKKTRVEPPAKLVSGQ